MEKKALIVANHAGFSSFLLNDMDILIRRGYEVYFAANGACFQWDDMKGKLDERNVHFVQVDFESKRIFSRENIKAYRQLRKVMAENKFDFIHCHTPIAGMLARFAAMGARWKGSCVVYTTHGLAFHSSASKKQKILFGTIETIGAFLSDAIITINREDYNSAKRLPCKRVYYIHGVGVDTKAYSDVQIDRNEYRHKIGVNEEDIMILSVGELSDRKNHQVIIKALAKIKEKEKYLYVICGNGIDGGTGRMLQELAQKEQVRVALLGFRFDIPQITACSDIGAIPSVREGLGLAGIQSLAAGIPVIGTDVQGIRDYIQHEETGVLCSAFDEMAFANGIEFLAHLQAENRKIMAENCRKMAQIFDIAVSHAEMEAIYNELL